MAMDVKTALLYAALFSTGGGMVQGAHILKGPTHVPVSAAAPGQVIELMCPRQKDPCVFFVQREEWDEVMGPDAPLPEIE